MSEDRQEKDLTATFLGKKVDVVSAYCPDFLVPIRRELNRNLYDINSDCLPFEGFDVWHCYEFSVLTENGAPVTRVLKLRYSAQSDYIVESKSLKLYLNSYNMSKFGKNEKECLDICLNQIKNDLGKALQTEIEASFLNINTHKKEIFKNYTNLTDLINPDKLQILEFNESPRLLQILDCNKVNEYYLRFDSLRSNCKVTHQPDFGDLFLYYKSRKMILPDSLIKYLVSFRCEYHFHEECCEMIYKRLHDILDKEDELFVAILYTRRGGIDITPVRYSKNLKFDLFKDLIDVKTFARFGIKQ